MPTFQYIGPNSPLNYTPLTSTESRRNIRKSMQKIRSITVTLSTFFAFILWIFLPFGLIFKSLTG